MPMVVKFWRIRINAMDPGKYMATPLFKRIMLTDATENDMHASATFIELFNVEDSFFLK